MTMETLGGKKRWASALSRELPSCALNEVRGRGPVLWALRKQDCWGEEAGVQGAVRSTQDNIFIENDFLYHHSLENVFSLV